jgi:CheY-like chemotaxis protein
MKTQLVLVIDDDRDCRETILAVLNVYGYYNVLQAADGQEGIKMIGQHQPALVITDLNMPKMRGEEVLRWIGREHKPLNPLVKTIALSGDNSEAVRRVAEAAGCDLFLNKPFKILDLKAAVGSLLPLS